MRPILWITLGLSTVLCIVGAVSIASAATPSFSKHIDPVERSFSVELPDGWQNSLGLTRSQGNYKLPRNWVLSRSPDGSTEWFIGDLNVPLFQTPMSQEMLANTGMPIQQAKEFMKNYFMKEGIAIREFQSAQQFAAEYVNRRYSNQPEFRVLGHSPNPELARAISALDKRLGNPPRQFETVTTRFKYAGHTGEVWTSSGYITPDNSMWSAEVSGFTTPQGAEDDDNTHSNAAKLFAKSALSLDISPKWLAREQQQAQQRQAQVSQQLQQNNARLAQQRQTMNQQHQQRMAALKNNFNAHQARMADQSAAFDQQNQAWRNNQEQSYQQHQSFVRGIHDRTVVESPNSWGGSSFEVDAGANNYYVDPLNNQYFGTDVPLDQGAIPDGYQEATEQSSSW